MQQGFADFLYRCPVGDRGLRMVMQGMGIPGRGEQRDVDQAAGAATAVQSAAAAIKVLNGGIRFLPYVLPTRCFHALTTRNLRDLCSLCTMSAHIRRFDDETHRAELYEAVYESEEWQSQIKPLVRQCIEVDKTIVHRVTGTRFSPMR